MDTSIIKLPVKDPLGTHTYVYAMITWKSSPNTIFEIKIFDDNDASWSGRLSTSFAEVFCKDMVESIEEYCANVKKCLTTVSNLYVYEFYEQGNDAKFTWNKMFDDSIIQRHGSILVHKDAIPETKDTLIDKLIEKNEELIKKVAEFHKEIETLTINLNDSKAELLKFVDAKTSLETGLYEKFVHLLNAKKRRIQLLDENVRDYKVPVPENLNDID